MLRRLAVSCVALVSSFVFAAEVPAPQKTVNGYHLTAPPSRSQALTDAITANDQRLFDAFFNTCDLAVVGSLVTDDFEFYHDKGGLTVSKQKFVDQLKATCDRQRSGEDFRARRELVKDSLAVYPLNNFGAVETGVHRFYMVQPGKPDTFTEESLFTIVWKKDGADWKMARVLSYGHKLTD